MSPTSLKVPAASQKLSGMETGLFVLAGVVIGGLLTPTSTYVLDRIAHGRARKVAARQLWGLMVAGMAGLVTAAQERSLQYIDADLHDKIDAIDQASLLGALSDDDFMTITTALELLKEASSNLHAHGDQPMDDKDAASFLVWAGDVRDALNVLTKYALPDRTGPVPDVATMIAAS